MSCTASCTCLPCAHGPTTPSHAGIRSIILDQVAAGRIGRGEDALADAEDHVLLLEPARVQAFQVLVHPARHARQAGVIGVVDQVRRDQGQLGAVGVALVLVAATEQVVVDADVDLWRVVAHRIRAASFGGLGGKGEGSGKQAGQPEGCKAGVGRGAHRGAGSFVDFSRDTVPPGGRQNDHMALTCLFRKQHCPTDTM
ncbi:hypothetical protein G6F65_018397 [Rhizopus arrhizus]|nr:hypothetical protein G6F65_018397 [Rhizopus arrhizus]